MRDSDVRGDDGDNGHNDGIAVDVAGPHGAGVADELLCSRGKCCGVQAVSVVLASTGAAGVRVTSP